MKHCLAVLLFALGALLPVAGGGLPLFAQSADAPAAEASVAADRALLDALQRDAFSYMWDHAYPSGLAFENNRYADGPATTGGTGFGAAAVVVATERGWIAREAAVDRLLTLTAFLRDKTERSRLHGAFPHWLNGVTGATMPFGPQDVGADIVETAFLMQGLIIARNYFDGDGPEAELRARINELWHDVDWAWFTRGPSGSENDGLYWHWSPEYGFAMNMKVTGFNEGMVAYVLALASPTHPIPSEAYAAWSSTDEYRPTGGNGYTLEAGIPYGGPLFITHYSYIGLDPRRLADDKVPHGYWVRNVTQTLMNRAYCLETAPRENRYAADCWGLTSCDAKDCYRYSAPGNDSGTVAPTAALSAMPYTPHYSMQVLEALNGRFRQAMWGPCGPYDAFSLRDDWYARTYQAIDQLPIVCMVENYRSGLLWRLFMNDPDVKRGLDRAGLRPPRPADGFPEMVVALKPDGRGGHVPDACDLRRHPDTGLYAVPYQANKGGAVVLTLTDPAGATRRTFHIRAAPGRNELTFAFRPESPDAVHTLTLDTGDARHSLPLRLH